MKKLAFSLLGLVILTPVLVSPFDGRYVRFEHLLPEFNGKPVISIFSILQVSLFRIICSLCGSLSIVISFTFCVLPSSWSNSFLSMAFHKHKA